MDVSMSQASDGDAYGQAVWSCPANAGDKLRRRDVGLAADTLRSAQRRWQPSWFTGEITEQP
jgi:hypothetical protein